MNNLLPLWLAAIPLMGSPGPATISLAAMGAAFGFRVSLPYLAGIILGTATVLLMIAAGLTTLLLAFPKVLLVVSLIAAAYILYLAWKIATAPVGIDSNHQEATPNFTSGFFLAIANPKAFAAISAVYSGHTLLPEHWLADGLIKTAALSAVIVVVNTLWLAFGSSFSRYLSDSKIGKFINWTFAFLLVASVALALSSL